MSEPSRSDSPHAPVPGAQTALHPWHSAEATSTQGQTLREDDDPVTAWLLEQRRIDATEFAVLFAVHKLNARRPRSAWIRRTHLCRSSGLSQVSLTRVLNQLRQKGLIGMSRHPVDNCRARYMLIVG